MDESTCLEMIIHLKQRCSSMLCLCIVFVLFQYSRETKLRIVQKHTYFAPEKYTAGILYIDSLKGA